VRLGIHTSIARSFEDAALTAHVLGADTFQIFSSSPRMWRAAVPEPGAASSLRAACRRFGLTPLVIHTNYLINLASMDSVIRRRSITAFRGEIERATLLGARYLVTHPGSHRGQTVETAVGNLAAALAESTDGLRTRGLTLLLENTAGGGSTLGRRLEELAAIRAAARRLTSLPIGYCLDTCHLLAAGYDISTSEGLERTLEEAERYLRLERVPVLHANDSKTPVGSRRDRHQHIGRGFIGREGFRRVLTHPLLRDKAFILETPIDKPGDDRRNLRALRRLARVG
jgi:deoxyribonuclease-4